MINCSIFRARMTLPKSNLAMSRHLTRVAPVAGIKMTKAVATKVIAPITSLLVLIARKVIEIFIDGLYSSVALFNHRYKSFI